MTNECRNCKYNPYLPRLYADNDEIFCYGWCSWIANRGGFCSEYKERAQDSHQKDFKNGRKWIGVHDEYTCPVCTMTFRHLSALNFCPNCGVRLYGVIDRTLEIEDKERKSY